MVFSSISFLFFFLPLLFLCYFVAPKRFKNYVLLIFSLFFYFFGEQWYILLLLLSCLINYCCAIGIEKSNQKRYFIVGLIFNIGLLFYFKYMNFFLENISALFSFQIPTLSIVLPLGISFFTFQNISYLVDVYKKEIEREKNFFTYATYITLFPQLVAGPIVRYQDVKEELENRETSYSLFSEGITRFVIGFGKKVLIADLFAAFIDVVLGSSMTVLSYWMVAFAFTFQIYYDFSGYSDMAIGLGKMFGFHFKENFNYPLISKSITDFWRRWHISLSSFFKDYVYIPLGGNRTTWIKHIRNIFIVWLLTGLWHGASWNFIVWGLYFFAFLLLEKLFLKKYLKGGVFSHLYTALVILISFVIFSISDFNSLLTFLKGMFGIHAPLYNMESIYYLRIHSVLFIIALLGMGPYFKDKIKILKKGTYKKWIDFLEVVWIFIIFILSVCVTISGTFHPFLYFRF